MEPGLGEGAKTTRTTSTWEKCNGRECVRVCGSTAGTHAPLPPTSSTLFYQGMCAFGGGVAFSFIKILFIVIE